MEPLCIALGITLLIAIIAFVALIGYGSQL